jgi:hypothetical protein
VTARRARADAVAHHLARARGHLLTERHHAARASCAAVDTGLVLADLCDRLSPLEWRRACRQIGISLTDAELRMRLALRAGDRVRGRA